MLLLALFACRDNVDTAGPVDSGGADFDFDNDGFDLADDCNDADQTVFPGAEETANLVDDDCDGLVDEDLVSVGDVVISEIMSQGTVSWFEVLNLTDATLDVAGWQLGPVAIETSTLLKPNKRLLVADTQYFDGVEADIVVEGLELGGASGSLSVLMGEVELFAVAWDESWDVVAGRSLSQDPDYSDADADHWCAGKGTLESGDRGTPGAQNPLCWHLDHDGDGYTLDDGDCDDRDANASPQVEERWDGKDSDCNGLIDDMDLADIRHTTLTGQGCIAGHLGNLGVVGDQVVVGGYYCGYVMGDLSTDGELAALADASFVGGGYYNYFGEVSQSAGDLTGDGIPDLVVGGSDYYYPESQVAGGVWAGPLSGTLTSENAFGTLSGGSATSISGAGDLDGDGQADLVYGASGSYYGGVAYVFTDTQGAHNLADADMSLVGDNSSYGYFANRMNLGDVDGDGYDDLLASASGNDEGGSNAGAVYVFLGGAQFTGGSVGDEAYATLIGKSGGDALGWGGHPQVGDFGNGPGVVVPAATNSEVYLFDGVSPGVNDAADADLVIDGSRAPALFGLGLAVGDFDGNGNDDIAIGAPDSDQSYDYYGTGDYEDGTVYFVFPDRVEADRIDADSMHRSLFDSDTDFFGQTLLAHDINGDGTDDLLATGGYDTLVVVDMANEP